MDNSKNKYSRKSFFKAGQIVQHTNREIVLTPILYGFNICLTDKTDV